MTSTRGTAHGLPSSSRECRDKSSTLFPSLSWLTSISGGSVVTAVVVVVVVSRVGRVVVAEMRADGNREVARKRGAGAVSERSSPTRVRRNRVKFMVYKDG